MELTQAQLDADSAAVASDQAAVTEAEAKLADAESTLSADQATFATQQAQNVLHPALPILDEIEVAVADTVNAISNAAQTVLTGLVEKARELIVSEATPSIGEPPETIKFLTTEPVAVLMTTEVPQVTAQSQAGGGGGPP